VGAEYVTGQVEKGKENGTIHLQFFLQFKKPGKRVTALKKHCKLAHFEVVKINNGADEYCNKEDTRQEGPWTFGVRPARLNKKGDLARRNKDIEDMGAVAAMRSGLIPIKDVIKTQQAIDYCKLKDQQLLTTESATLRGTWIYGKPGVGKSRYARDNFTDIFNKAQSKWFDGYSGQKTILLDDHDDPCLGHLLKLWMDHYDCTGETKGATVPLLHRDFVVTSNYSVDQLYESKGEEMIDAIKRRCKIIHMTAPFTDQQKKDDKEKN
jgi:hypothetical protein